MTGLHYFVISAWHKQKLRIQKHSRKSLTWKPTSRCWKRALRNFKRHCKVWSRDFQSFAVWGFCWKPGYQILLIKLSQEPISWSEQLPCSCVTAFPWTSLFYNNNNNNLHLYCANLYMNIFGCALQQYRYIKFMLKHEKLLKTTIESIKNYLKKF